MGSGYENEARPEGIAEKATAVGYAGKGEQSDRTVDDMNVCARCSGVLEYEARTARHSTASTAASG